MADKSSFFTRPDGRIRSAVIVPLLLALLVIVALVWQTMHGPS